MFIFIWRNILPNGCFISLAKMVRYVSRGGVPKTIFWSIHWRRSQPDIPVPLKSPDSLAIEIPYFKTKDPRYYNFLPPRAKKALERTIYIRFRIELWNELHTFDSLSHNLSDLIWTFMEKHEIADDPKSWETIRQMYFRMRKTYQKKQQRNATSSKEEFNNTVQNAQ